MPVLPGASVIDGSSTDQGHHIEFERCPPEGGSCKIEKDYGYVFLYNEKEIKLDKKVSCNFKNADIEVVMTKILGAEYSFKVKNRQVVILPNPAGVSQDKQKQDAGAPKKRQITGTVTDANGEPLAGVGVFEKVRPMEP